MSIPNSYRSYKIQHPLKDDFSNLEITDVQTPKPTGE